MNFEEFISTIEKMIPGLVWWSPEQIARGEHTINDPKKGERAWSIPRKTAEFLSTTILENRSKNILELGTSIGYSTLWMAHALQKTGGHIDTIERSTNKIPVATKNIQDAGFQDLVTIHQGEINTLLKDFSGCPSQFDFVFMDADRGHYHEYFPLLKSLLSPGAMIIADNAGNMTKRMQPFLDLLTKEGWVWEIKDLDNGLLLAHKPSSTMVK